MALTLADIAMFESEGDPGLGADEFLEINDLSLDEIKKSIFPTKVTTDAEESVEPVLLDTDKPGLSGEPEEDESYPDPDHFMKVMRQSGVDFCTDPVKVVEYKPLPKTFTSPEEWPTSTTIMCWYCDESSISTSPYFIPIGIFAETKSGKTIYTYDVYGCFCCVNCASAYIHFCIDEKLNNTDRGQRDELMSMLKDVHQAISGQKLVVVPPSPSRTMMIQHGGKITRAEYRKMVSVLNERMSKSLRNASIESAYVDSP